jgi:hypothetical protein
MHPAESATVADPLLPCAVRLLLHTLFPYCCVLTSGVHPSLAIIPCGNWVLNACIGVVGMVFCVMLGRADHPGVCGQVARALSGTDRPSAAPACHIDTLHAECAYSAVVSCTVVWMIVLRVDIGGYWLPFGRTTPADISAHGGAHVSFVPLRVQHCCCFAFRQEVCLAVLITTLFLLEALSHLISTAAGDCTHTYQVCNYCCAMDSRWSVSTHIRTSIQLGGTCLKAVECKADVLPAHQHASDPPSVLHQGSLHIDTTVLFSSLPRTWQ